MADTNTGSTGRASPRKYPPELKQRAIRMVLDAFDRGEERFGTVTRIANELGIGSESLRRWVVQAEIDRGRRAGTTSEEARRISELTDLAHGGTGAWRRHRPRTGGSSEPRWRSVAPSRRRCDHLTSR